MKFKITIKQLLSIIVTVLMLAVLFGVIFVEGEIRKPSPTFYLELLIITSLIVIIRFNWFNWAQDKKLNEEDIKKQLKTYDDYADDEIKDIYDFENFLKTLNEDNRKYYIKNKMKNRTRENCPKYDELLKKYTELSYKKVKEIKSSDVKTRGDTLYLIDSKNHLNTKKWLYQGISTAGSVILTIILAYIGYKEMLLSWTNVFRYVAYVFSMAWTALSTITFALRTTGRETEDHLKRLQFIVDKYVNWKEGKYVSEVIEDGKDS